MMNKSHRLISGLCVAAASLAMVVGAQAQSNSSSSNAGYMTTTPGNSYIGLSAGQSDFKLDSGIGLFNREKNDAAYSISAGSFMTNNFGFEVGYTDFGRVARAGGNTKANGINLSLLGRLPLGMSFNLLGKLGTIYSRTDVSSDPASGITAGTENDFGWSYGVGAEYTFTPQWSMVLQYDEHDLKYAGGNRDRVDVTSLGLRYRF